MYLVAEVGFQNKMTLLYNHLWLNRNKVLRHHFKAVSNYRNSLTTSKFENDRRTVSSSVMFAEKKKKNSSKEDLGPLNLND